MFKDRLRAARITRGHTQQEMADHIGIALRSYQKYESGDSEPAFDYLVMLADFLNVSADFLLGRDDYLKKMGIDSDIPHEGPPRRGERKLK